MIELPLTAAQLSDAANVGVIASCGLLLMYVFGKGSGARVISTIAIIFGGVLSLAALIAVLADSNKTDSNNALVGQIITAGYFLLSVVRVVAQKSHAPEAPAPAPVPHEASSPRERKGVEEKRREQLHAAAGVFAVGVVGAIVADVVPAITARWGQWPRVWAYVLIVMATALMISILWGKTVPEYTAVAQRGRCYKPGERYLALDDDRHISLRPDVCIADIPAQQKTVFIEWRPDVENLLVFVKRFASETEAELYLKQLAERCGAKKIVAYALKRGIDVVELPRAKSTAPKLSAKRMQLPPATT
jgi:hypothetical protein